MENDQGGYRPGGGTPAQLPCIDRAQARRIMDEAHKTAPIPKPCAATLSVTPVAH